MSPTLRFLRFRYFFLQKKQAAELLRRPKKESFKIQDARFKYLKPEHPPEVSAMTSLLDYCRAE